MALVLLGGIYTFVSEHGKLKGELPFPLVVSVAPRLYWQSITYYAGVVLEYVMLGLMLGTVVLALAYLAYVGLRDAKERAELMAILKVHDRPTFVTQQVGHRMLGQLVT